MKIRHKGDVDTIVVIVALIFVLFFTFISWLLGKHAIMGFQLPQILQQQYLVQVRFAFGGEFQDMVGESNNIFSANSFEFVEKLNTKLDPKLTTFIEFYILANSTNGNVHLNLSEEKISAKELGEKVYERLKENGGVVIPEDVYYKVLVGGFEIIQNKEKEGLKGLGKARLPLPIPGEKIEFFLYERSDSSEGIILTEEGGGK
jgi:hypothetical protein